MGGQEQHYIHQAFASNYIAPLGEHVDAFEKALSAATGVAHAAVLSSGTAAIHLALILLGVGPGDRVLCQSFTFAGTVNPVIYQGATPVLIDSEPNTWNMESPFAGGIRSVKTYFLPGISRLDGTGAYAGVDVWVERTVFRIVMGSYRVKGKRKVKGGGL